MDIQTQEVAFEAFLAVLKADQATCESTGVVPLRLYSKYNKTYIGLRKDTTAAVERAGMLFGTKCHVNKDTILLLRIHFSRIPLRHFAFCAFVCALLAIRMNSVTGLRQCTEVRSSILAMYIMHHFSSFRTPSSRQGIAITCLDDIIGSRRRRRLFVPQHCSRSGANASRHFT